MAREDSVFDVTPAARAAEAAIDESRESALDEALGWVGTYVPTWGTSIILHAAAIILSAFVWEQTVRPQDEPIITSSALPQRQRPVEHRPRQDKKQTEGRGKLRPGMASIAPRLTDIPLPDVADNRLAQLQIIGIGGGGEHEGGWGLRDGGGLFPPPPVEEGTGKVAYIVDRSGSMTDSLDYVKLELKRSLWQLGAENEFHVIFYSSGPPVEMPTRRLVNATDRNRQLAFEFIDSVIAWGGTDPTAAIERAFAVQPDIIYFLTDGEFDRAVVGLVRRLNAGRKVRVNTINFLYDGNADVLKQIAAENGGEYKFVREADLAAIAGG